MMKRVMLGLIVAALAAGAGCQAGRGGARIGSGGGSPSDGEHEAVSAALDAVHAAASQADGARYFSLFTPDAVFLGTAPEERWTLEEFRAYAEPHFAAGRGWTYTPERRYIRFGPGAETAWFDEVLTNAKLGECRGTGVLVRGRDGQWRVAQYNLTIPVPNELAGELVRQIRARQGRADTEP